MFPLWKQPATKAHLEALGRDEYTVVGFARIPFVTRGILANPTTVSKFLSAKVKGFVEKFDEFKVVPGCEKYWAESE